MTFREEVLQQLARVGSDISRPHEFDFYVYFPSHAAAQKAAEKARQSNFAVKVRRGASNDNWLCLATTTIVPETAALDAMADFFEQVAATFDGDFDGWEADVAKPSRLNTERN